MEQAGLVTSGGVRERVIIGLHCSASNDLFVVAQLSNCAELVGMNTCATKLESVLRDALD